MVYTFPDHFPCYVNIYYLHKDEITFVFLFLFFLHNHFCKLPFHWIAHENFINKHIPTWSFLRFVAHSINNLLQLKSWVTALSLTQKLLRDIVQVNIIRLDSLTLNFIYHKVCKPNNSISITSPKHYVVYLSGCLLGMKRKENKLILINFQNYSTEPQFINSQLTLCVPSAKVECSW